jgi:hypothetical protein
MTEYALERFDRGSPDWAAMVALAAAGRPGFDATAYLARRAEHYDRVAVAREGGALFAVQLLQEFEEDGARHVYLGPLFSRTTSSTALFAWLFDELLADPRPFHLLTEVQSPRVALLFKRLFPVSSWPLLDRATPPSEVTATATRYARRLDHVGALDLSTLSTRYAETLYRGPEGYDAVVAWMAQRGVDLDRGDAMIFLVSVGRSKAERASVRFEMWQGLLALQDWPACKHETLAWFERSDLPETTFVEASA